jgi:hypothetical protein
VVNPPDSEFPDRLKRFQPVVLAAQENSRINHKISDVMSDAAVAFLKPDLGPIFLPFEKIGKGHA